MAVLADNLITSQLAWDIMVPSSLRSAFSIGGRDKLVWVAVKTLRSAWALASVQRISWGYFSGLSAGCSGPPGKSGST